MAKIQRFEDLQVWLKARELANAIYDLTDNSMFKRDHELREQIRRAAPSVMHNIAEGFDSGSGAEFIRFLKMGRRSASEVQSELYLALDRKYISPNELNCVYDLAVESKRLINGMVTYLRQRPKSK